MHSFSEVNLEFLQSSKAFDCGSQHWKILQQELGIPGHLSSWEIYMQVRKQKLELDVEQQTDTIWERSTSSLYVVTLLI